jgi:hypothetical protein
LSNVLPKKGPPKNIMNTSMDGIQETVLDEYSESKCSW